MKFQKLVIVKTWGSVMKCENCNNTKPKWQNIAATNAITCAKMGLFNCAINKHKKICKCHTRNIYPTMKCYQPGRGLGRGSCIRDWQSEDSITHFISRHCPCTDSMQESYNE